MTLCDTGPLVALINERDKNHVRCRAILPALSRPLVTTWPCFAEAMYLLYKYGGHRAQDKLWQLLENDAIEIYVNGETKRVRMRALMRQYSDTPMDLADASLVSAAAVLQRSFIFTLDSDFRIYRLPSGSAFEIAP